MGGKVIRGDMTKVLPRLESQSFDVIATDVPYGEAMVWNGTHDWHINDRDVARTLHLLRFFIAEAARLLKPEGYLYTTLGKGYIMPQAFIAAENAGFKTRPFAWIKPTPILTGPNRPWKQNIDVCLWGYRKMPTTRRYERCGERNYFECNVPRGQTRVHPTQKPVALYEYWLGQTPGRVLDPFCGVGTTLLAAQRLGLDYVGVELNREYAQEAVRRLRLERVHAVRFS